MEQVVEMARKKIKDRAERAERRRRGGQFKHPIKRLSEPRFVRLDPVLDAALDIRRKQMADRAGISKEAIEIAEVIRDLMRLGARACGIPVEP